MCIRDRNWGLSHEPRTASRTPERRLSRTSAGWPRALAVSSAHPEDIHASVRIQWQRSHQLLLERRVLGRLPLG
eukprot:6704172-Pyramimonas_sp.AAC.1